MPRIIWIIFQSFLCMTHNRHPKGRASAINPGWIQRTQSFTLGKTTTAVVFLEVVVTLTEGGGRFSALSVGLQLCSFHRPPPPRYTGSKPVSRTQRKVSFSMYIIYNIANAASVPSVLNLTGIIKVKKNIF